MVTLFTTLQFDAPFVPHPSERSAITLDTKSGLGMLIYTWITGCAWPCILFWMVSEKRMIDDAIFDLTDPDFKAEEGGSTSRDVISYIQQERFAEVSQLLKFGYNVPDDYVDYDVKIFLSFHTSLMSFGLVFRVRHY